jgi:hypothetical protein
MEDLDQQDLYDSKGKAKHYNDNRIDLETIFIKVWGLEAYMIFCEMNAMKYRYRIGKKNSSEEELKKINWYENRAKEILKQINNGKVN